MTKQQGGAESHETERSLSEITSENRMGLANSGHWRLVKYYEIL